jgi:hypothetical protein
MTTANFEETPPPAEPPRGFRRPADYYSLPTPDPAFPTWLSLGCGALSLVVLLVIFAAGVWLSSGGLGQLIDMTLGMTLGELRGMYEPTVAAKDKDELEAEVRTLRENLRNERLAPASVDPLLRAMRGAMGDSKVTTLETDQMTATAAKINTSAKKK